MARTAEERLDGLDDEIQTLRDESTAHRWIIRELMRRFVLGFGDPRGMLAEMHKKLRDQIDAATLNDSAKSTIESELFLALPMPDDLL